MAGMLPGVECARRRRLHQGGSTDSITGIGTRRPSFCLYASAHDTHFNTNTWQRNVMSQSFQAEKLGVIAREAKERLDEKLKNQKKPQILRHGRISNIGPKDDGNSESFRSLIVGSEHREMSGPTKKSSKGFSWATLGWKAAEQDECVICLERFTAGELLAHLPCAHRFHSRCLVPWLESNRHCPCCRTEILS